MRGLLAVALALFAADGLRAGVYVPADPPEKPTTTDPQGFRYFHDIQLDAARRRPVAVVKIQNGDKVEEKQNPEHDRLQKRVTELGARVRAGWGTLEDRVNLSGTLLRLLDPRQSTANAETAIRLLEAVPADQRDFQAWANLATAYQLSNRDLDNRLENARDCQRQALKVWPNVHVRYSENDLIWFRIAEGYQLELIQSRYREAVRDRGRGPQGTTPTLDTLFPVRLGYRNGKYQPGSMRPEDMAHIPFGVHLTLEQLVLWLPFDDRLYWQLAEMANVQGDVLTAANLLRELQVQRQFAPPELRDHRQVLEPARDWLEAIAYEAPRIRDAQRRDSAAGLHGLLPLGVAPVLNAGGLVAAINDAVSHPGERKANLDFQPPSPSEASAATAQPPKASFDWRAAGAGFALGLVVMFLFLLQLREVARRRQLGADKGFVKRG